MSSYHAQAGRRTTFAGYVGQDGQDFLREALDSYGVDCTHLQTAADVRANTVPNERMLISSMQLPTGRALIQLDTSTRDNAIILLHGANFNEVSALPDDLSAYAVLVLQNEIPLQHTAAALREAKSAGLKTVFNPSPMPSQAECVDFPFELVDWLLLNEDEASALSAALGPQNSATAQSGQSTNSDLSALHQHLGSTTRIVITLGSEGMIATGPAPSAWDLENPIRLPAGKLLQELKDTVRSLSTTCSQGSPTHARSRRVQGTALLATLLHS